MLVALLILDATGHLPPPAVMNNVCADEKLKFLREHPPQGPTLALFGSSVTWRNVESARIVEVTGGRVVPLNLGFCGSRIHESGAIARYFLGRYPTISSVALIVGLEDVKNCRGPARFSADDAKDYLDRATPKYFFYFKHFDFMSLNRNARTIKARRTDIASAESLVLDGFAGAPSLMQRGLFYDGQFNLDETCLGALRAFVADLPPHIKQIIVVLSPIHPDWVAKYDPSGSRLTGLAAALSSSVAATRASLWNAHADLDLPRSFFGDAIHLRRPGTHAFSERLAMRLPPATQPR
jgi:hypothetical protein